MTVGDGKLRVWESLGSLPVKWAEMKPHLLPLAIYTCPRTDEDTGESHIQVCISGMGLLLHVDLFSEHIKEFYDSLTSSMSKIGLDTTSVT